MTSLTFSPAQPFSARQAADLLRAHPRESAGIGILLLAAVLSVAAVAGPSGAVPLRTDAEAAPAPAQAVQAMTPFAVRQLGRSEAEKLNAALPLATGPNPAAAPFRLRTDSKTYGRALHCLSQAIYYEAARESADGQRAVAQVVLNRMRHPAYPASVCAVVYQGAERPTGCQFSFTCDGSLARAPMRSYWDRARHIAHQALQGYVHAPVGNATHYHANYVMPYWAPTLVKNAVIGAHIFYRWPGGWGRPDAFSQKWAKQESDPWALRSAALAAEARHAGAAAAAAALPGEESEIVIQARQELPPELARLVEAEIGTKGETRVSMTIGKPRGTDPAAAPSSEPAAAMSASNDLKWGLTGKGEGNDEAPLGRRAEPETAAK